MHRRELLCGLAGTATLTTAGCLSREEELPAGTLRFSVTNTDDVERSISIDITIDGSRSGASGRLPPAAEQDQPFQFIYPSEGVPVEAVVTADGGSKTLEWDPAECNELQVTVEIVDGTPEIEQSCL